MDTLLKILTYVSFTIAGASGLALALRGSLPALKSWAEGTHNSIDNIVVKYLGYFVKAAVWLGEVVLPLVSKLALNPKSKTDA